MVVLEFPCGITSFFCFPKRLTNACQEPELGDLEDSPLGDNHIIWELYVKTSSFHGKARSLVFQLVSHQISDAG